MSKPIIATLAAALAATPALAVSGIAPDPQSMLMLAAGASMVGMAAAGRRQRAGRVAD